MTTLSLVDPAHRDLVGGFPGFDATEGSLTAFRPLLVAGMTAALTPEPVAAEERWVPGLDGAPDVRVLLHRPAGAEAAAPAILYIHGGGMVAGTPDMYSGALRDLALATGALVVAPDYRLAPETPFPGGLEDLHAVLLWLHANAADLGVDPARLVLMGDSGGGGLAAGLALLARDRGQVPLRAQVLIYPMLDARTGRAEAPSDDPLTGEFVWTRVQNRLAWEWIAPDTGVQPGVRGYFSPAEAHDLTGLPPAYMMTGALDLFRDEDITFAQRLMQAGIPTELKVYPGAVHGFDVLLGDIAARARADVLQALQRLL